MGQRLVITIKNKERELAAIYYHWSAYTYSALCRTKDVIDCLYNHRDETEHEMLLRLIKFLEATGGGIRARTEEFEYIQELYPSETFKTDDYSRNCGLIALSKEGIADLQYWSEGDVYINLDSDTIDFSVYSGYDNIASYIEDRKAWDDDFDDSELKDIPKADCELGHFGIEDIDYVMSEIEGVGNAYVIQCGSEICELIE